MSTGLALDSEANVYHLTLTAGDYLDTASNPQP